MFLGDLKDNYEGKTYVLSTIFFKNQDIPNPSTVPVVALLTPLPHPGGLTNLNLGLIITFLLFIILPHTPVSLNYLLFRFPCF